MQDPQRTVAILDEISASTLLKRLKGKARMLVDPWNQPRLGERRLPSYPLGWALARAHDNFLDYFDDAMSRWLEAELDFVSWAYSRLWAELVADLSEVVPSDEDVPPSPHHPRPWLEYRSPQQITRAEAWADRLLGFHQSQPEPGRYISSPLWREVISLASGQRRHALSQVELLRDDDEGSSPRSSQVSSDAVVAVSASP